MGLNKSSKKTRISEPKYRTLVRTWLGRLSGSPLAIKWRWKFINKHVSKYAPNLDENSHIN